MLTSHNQALFFFFVFGNEIFFYHFSGFSVKHSPIFFVLNFIYIFFCFSKKTNIEE